LRAARGDAADDLRDVPRIELLVAGIDTLRGEREKEILADLET